MFFTKQKASQQIYFFVVALFKEDINKNGIDDQNNDNIIDEPQDIHGEYGEDVEDNNNEVVHISCIL